MTAGRDRKAPTTSTDAGIRRRELLASAALGAAAAGCRRAGARAGGAESGEVRAGVADAPASAEGSAGRPVITAETLEEAEKLALVEYAPEARAQILEVVDDHLDRVRARRALSLPRELPPAVTFDPRLPGTEVPGRVRARPAPPIDPGDPGADEDIAFASVATLGAWLRRGALRSTELTELYLDRLQRYGDPLRCVAAIARDRALASASRADRELREGRDRGPLHGIPYGAKDLFDTAGTRTGWGARPYRHRVPDEDAAAIRATDEAGGVLVAKLSLGALAYGDLWYGGRTRNPWNAEEGASGSSAGSAAAVTAGLVGFALGTETVGSIISPGLRCGAAGLRPTFGQVSREGAMPLCWSLDNIGPMARRVEDTALALAPLVGAGDGDPAARGGGFEYDGERGAEGRRVGVVRRWMAQSAAPDHDAAIERALRRAGADIVDVAWPELPYDALMPILYAEAAAAFEELTLSGRDTELEWQEPEAWPNMFRMSRFLSGVDIIQAERLRRRAMREVGAALADVDAVLAPAGVAEAVTASNFTGHPALVLRAAFVESSARPGTGVAPTSGGDARRVPHGVSLIGRLYGEGPLVEIGGALERALGVWAERPDLGRVGEGGARE